jgi:hypothetical protein
MNPPTAIILDSAPILAAKHKFRIDGFAKPIKLVLAFLSGWLPDLPVDGNQ